MFVLRPYWFAFALVAFESPIPAQYPGQYPPGNGGVGIPFPRRHKKEEQAQLQSTDGMLRRVQKDQIVVEADDHRILNFKRTGNTKFLKLGNAIKPADLIPGDYIEIEASEDDEGFLTAVNVMWQQDGSAKDRAHAAEPVEVSIAKGSKDHDKDSEKDAKDSDKDNAKDSARADAKNNPAPDQGQSAAKPASPAAAQSQPADDDQSPADLNAPAKDQARPVQIDSDDQGPPVLKRGGKVAHKEADPAPPAAPSANPPGTELSARNEPPAADSEPPVRGPQRPEEVVIEKAREAAGSFLETLPNYVCQEIMTRYQTAPGSKNFQPIDIVSMALVYENGKESYRNLTIGGKATKKNIEDLSGSWSTGEFGSVLADIFSPATSADFEYRRESRSGGRQSLVYDFSVEREHSHWRIMVASQLITPAYSGSVWVDKETKRVLRIEMQATHIPDAFPSDRIEMATDYEFVRFGDRQFLVPVHAENLGCQRDTNTCSRNAIDFRNYHKYAGEANISFENK
jgi:hypothetical protein